VGGVVGGLAIIGIVLLGIFYMFFRSRRKAPSFETGAAVALMKQEESPTASTASPAYALSQQSTIASHNVSPADSRDPDDQQQPLISHDTTPVEICENPRAGPPKDQAYVELPTQSYKVELPS
jgi:FtsZ-interacting cell division protein ZipA